MTYDAGYPCCSLPEKYEARIADLQRALDAKEKERLQFAWSAANESDLAVKQHERAEKAERALDAERERAAQLEAALMGADNGTRAAQADLAAERQARQQAEGERDEWVLMYPRSLVEMPDKFLESLMNRNAGLKARLADAVGLLREAAAWFTLGSKGQPLKRLVGFKASAEWLQRLDRVDASAEEPAAAGDGR